MVLREIDNLVQLPRLKPTVKPDKSIAGCELVVVFVSKRPARSRNGLTIAGGTISNREHVLLCPRIGNRISSSADLAQNHMCQRPLVSALCRCPVSSYESIDASAIRCESLWRVQS